MSDVTKADIIAFRNRLLTQVSAKTANHDLRAVKTLFKSARQDGVIAEDPAASVKAHSTKPHLQKNGRLLSMSFASCWTLPTRRGKA